MYEESRIAARLYQEAVCQSEEALFSSPEITDILAAITICHPCPVKYECLQILDPFKTFFDGVAGGFHWKDGRRIPHDGEHLLAPTRRHECGTPYGYEKHRRSAETACRACLEAVRQQKAANRRAVSEIRRDTTLPFD